MKTQAIIVPEYKFMYVVIPKAACGSMKDAIVKILGLEWRGETHVNWRKGRISKVDIEASEFDNYFRFAFVRSPFARVVSAYYSHIKTENVEYSPKVQALLGSRIPTIQAKLAPIGKNTGKADISFDDFVYYLKDGKDDELNIHWRPQHTFVSTDGQKGKRLLVDFVGKVENIEEDWKKICHRIGVQAEIPHENRTSHPAYAECYTAETWDIVADRYREDIRIFGYEAEADAMRPNRNG